MKRWLPWKKALILPELTAARLGGEERTALEAEAAQLRRDAGMIRQLMEEWQITSIS